MKGWLPNCAAPLVLVLAGVPPDVLAQKGPDAPPQRAAAPQARQAPPVVTFVAGPAYVRSDEATTVWAVVRVAPLEGAGGASGRRQVVLQARSSSASLFATGESTVDGRGFARVTARLPASAGGDLVWVTAYIRDQPAASTGEIALRLSNRVRVDLEIGLTILAPGLPSVIDKLFTATPEPFEAIFLLIVRPKLSVNVWNGARTQVTAFAEQPFVGVSRAVVPTPGLVFPPTTDALWGRGDPEAGVSVRWHDLVSGAVAFNGRSGGRSVGKLHRVGAPGSLSTSDAFQSLNLYVNGEYTLGRVLLVGSFSGSNPLRQRLGEGTVARAGRTFHLAGGVGTDGRTQTGRTIFWFGYTRFGEIDVKRADSQEHESVVPPALDRLVGVTVQKRGNERLGLTASFFVGGLGARPYVGGGLSVNTSF